MSLLERGLLKLLNSFTFFLDLLTFVPYYMLQDQGKTLQISSAVKAKLDRDGHYYCLENQDTKNNDCRTLAELFEKAATLNSASQCIGTREFFKEEDEVQPNGRVFKKLILGEYEWKTFGEVLQEVIHLGRGLIKSGLKPGEKILIFAETRADWVIAAQACFRNNITVVTLYATLGEEAIIHGVNETDVTHIVTSGDLLPKFKKMLPKMPHVQHITYMKGKYSVNVSSVVGSSDVQIVCMAEVTAAGKAAAEEISESPPSADDIAVIMYTSGSTGLPKGVMLSHSNCVAAVAGLQTRCNVGPDDVYVGYLPLAHILELCAETTVLCAGAKIGYSSPNTLSDASTAIKKGNKGDVSLLMPTIMACVPTVMDRIYKSVWEKVESGGIMKRVLFKFGLEYKRYWMAKGAQTPIIDSVVMSAVANLLGGRVRAILSGGAPLSPDTQEFIMLTLCCPVIQGYGLTETCSCGTAGSMGDLKVDHVGAPLTCVKLKLKDWEEGGYRSTDKPPRGEVWLGGPTIAIGYFKNETKTREEFHDEDGIRWFSTGDIGQVNPDGTVKIIDRKKDLVKLQAGEYVSLGKVEACLKLCPLMDNICVFASSQQMYTVAVIVPNPKALQELADDLKITSDWSSLCADKRINQQVLKQLKEQASKGSLEKFEVPQKIKLTTDTWTPDTGLVTDSLKHKRKPLFDQYQADINAMYK